MNDEIVRKFMNEPMGAKYLLGASLEKFIKFFHWYMYRQEFIVRDFHKEIIEKLEGIAFGKNERKNLIINIPPRFGKSSIMKYACAWAYLLNPKSNCIYTSYSDDLVNSFSKDIRAIVTSEAFKLFSGVELDRSKTGADYWATRNGGGFRASPMGGSITGYGCFSYQTKVITDEGIKPIGEIVEKKEKVRFKSWNGKDEWVYPNRYIKNEDSEFLRILMNDGQIIDCTPDHKFYTSEGIKRADELTCGSVFPSYTFDNISFYTKFKAYFRNRVVFVADKLSLFFRGNIFVNRDSFACNTDSLSFSSPVNTCFNIRDIINRCVKVFSNFFVSSRVGSYLFHLFNRKFAVSVMRSVFNRILFVIRLIPISKVIRGIIRRISVKVSCYLSFLTSTYKCFCNKLMNSTVSAFNFNKKIPLFCFPRLKNSKGVVEMTSDSSQRGNFVDSIIFRDRKPSFIYKIGHFPSYCVTIPSNHNFFLGGSQQVLVGNSGVAGDEFGGWLLIDDPLKASNVKSQAELQNCVDYYVNTLKSRCNNQKRTPIVIIMQRLALEDLTGYVLENEKDDWDIVKLPALDEDSGEALWEERFPANELLKLKEQAPFVYYGQYQQEPIVLGGSVFKTEWFRFYPTKDTFTYQFSFITADTAQKKGEGNDFTVLEFWGKTIDNRLHLIDMVRGKFDAEELREQVLLFWDKCKDGIGEPKCPPYGIYIEDKSSGIGVIQELKKNYPIPVIPISRNRFKNDAGMMVSQDKFSRAMTGIPYIANGWVYLPNSENDDISKVLLAETSAFKADLSHKHDDTIDPMLDAIDIAFGSTGISSIFI